MHVFLHSITVILYVRKRSEHIAGLTIREELGILIVVTFEAVLF